MDHTLDSGTRRPPRPRRWYRQLYFWVLVAIVIGIFLGWLAVLRQQVVDTG